MQKRVFAYALARRKRVAAPPRLFRGYVSLPRKQRPLFGRGSFRHGLAMAAKAGVRLLHT